MRIGPEELMLLERQIMNNFLLPDSTSNNTESLHRRNVLFQKLLRSYAEASIHEQELVKEKNRLWEIFDMIGIFLGADGDMPTRLIELLQFAAGEGYIDWDMKAVAKDVLEKLRAGGKL